MYRKQMLLTHYQSQESQKLLSFSYTFLMVCFLIQAPEMVMVELMCRNLISLQNITTQGLNTHFRAFINT